jgi:hypothetical protein
MIQCDQMGWANDLRECVNSLLKVSRYSNNYSIKFISLSAFGYHFDQDLILKLAGDKSDLISFYEDRILEKDGAWQRCADLLNSAIDHAISEGCSYATAGDVRCRLMPNAIDKFSHFGDYFKYNRLVGCYWRVPWFNYDEMQNFENPTVTHTIRCRTHHAGIGINSYKGSVSDLSEMATFQFAWSLHNQKEKKISFEPASSAKNSIIQTVSKMLAHGETTKEKELIESYVEMWSVPFYLTTETPKNIRHQKKYDELIDLQED